MTRYIDFLLEVIEPETMNVVMNKFTDKLNGVTPRFTDCTGRIFPPLREHDVVICSENCTYIRVPIPISSSEEDNSFDILDEIRRSARS